MVFQKTLRVLRAFVRSKKMILWPGTTGLFRYGRWSFLAIAVAFALLVDLFLVLNFYWSAMITTTQRNTLLLLLAIAWIALTMLAKILEHRIVASKTVDPGDKIFAEASQHYMRGNWFEAESLLTTLLKKNPRDIESALMHATLCRRTGRWVEAKAILDHLSFYEESGRWFREIEMERRMVAEAEIPAEPLS